MPRNPVPAAPVLEPIVVPDRFDSLWGRLRHVADVLPDRTALTGPGGTFTYARLIAAVEDTARELRPRIGDGDEPVGVLMTYDVPALLVLLALTRLDRVFINLDPVAPPARSAAVVEGSGMRVCITDDAHADALVGLDVPLEAVRVTGSADPDVVLPEPVRRGSDTLYLVFTSGSTGKPKGVVQTHAQTVNEAFITEQLYGATPEDVFAPMFPLAFVAGMTNALSVLMLGASLHLIDARTHSPRGIADAITGARPSILIMTPHLLRALAAELRADEVLDSVRAVATLGESITGRDVEALSAHLPDEADHLNLFGSSEATATSVMRLRGGRADGPGAVPAGVAVPTREVWIIREDGSRADAGETGQVVVASHFLSGGYYRNPEVNAEKFATLPDGRTRYLQGDLGRMDEHGVLHLGGRADNAVKVRGYLVDMSEIENALRAVPGVTEALALPVVEEGRPTRLIAYVAQSGDVRQVSVAELRRILRSTLPEYMVPSVFVPLAAFPRNERGKIDRQALPQPAEVEVDDTVFSQHELVVQQLWGGVLGLAKVPRDGDFMALGGDSLSVEEMLAEVGDRLGIQLSSTDVLAAPTLREFALLLERREKGQRVHSDSAVLRTGDGSRRLFAFVGAGALALQFLPVSRHLDGWDVVAFQAHGLERRARPDRTVEAHALRALAEMREIQPHGPYRLAGHSFGGIIALEIAARLVAAGETVDLVALFDTYLPGSAVDELTVTEQFGRLETRRPTSWLQRTADAVLPRRADRTLSEMSFLRATSVIVRARTAGLLRYSGQRQFDTFFYHSVLAARRHAVQPYDGRVLVVTAPTNTVVRSEWTGVLRGDVRFVEVASEHSAMLREPHASELAAVLLDALDHSETRVPA